MFTKALLVALVYYICTTAQWFGLFHFNRPIVVSTLVGLVLGDLKTGVILGATFEAAFLGIIAIGGSAPADATIGATIGSSLGIISSLGTDDALAIATPVALVGLMLMAVPINLIYSFMVDKAQKYLANGDTKKFDRLPILMGFVAYIFQAIIVFVAVYFGATAVNVFFTAAPGLLLGGIGKAAAIMPAVGMALLLNTLYDRKLIIFFFVGFIASIYLKLSSLVIAVLAIAIGIYTFIMMPDVKGDKVAPTANNEEDFYK